MTVTLPAARVAAAAATLTEHHDTAMLTGQAMTCREVDALAVILAPVVGIDAAAGWIVGHYLRPEDGGDDEGDRHHRPDLHPATYEELVAAAVAHLASLTLADLASLTHDDED